MADEQQTEQVDLKLPSGEMVTALVPKGMSDEQVKGLMQKKHPEFYGSAIPGAPSGPPKMPMVLPKPEYTGERKFEMNVAKGFGLDPQKLAEAEASGGNLAALKNIGGQATSGVASALPGAIKTIAKDPLRGITGPIDAMASNIVKPTGLPDTGSALNPKGYSRPNPGQLVGALGATELAGNVGEGIGEKVVGPLSEWIGSSKTFGAKMLQEASAKAGSAPVELSPKTNQLIDEIVAEGKSGGKIPKVISDLLERVGPSVKQAAEAEPGPLTYEEARRFQGNLSSMSTNEKLDLKGRLKYLIPETAKSFSGDVQAGANKAGIGPQHAIGMNEYATASSRNRTLKKVGKTVAAGAGIYGAEQLIKKAVGGLKP